MLACDEGNIEIVDLLLQYSADPNLEQPVSKIEVLYYRQVENAEVQKPKYRNRSTETEVQK